MTRHWVGMPALLLACALAFPAAAADKKYAPGVTDTEIKLGQTMPYSGPASSYSTIGKVEAAYIKMINEEGGVLFLNEALDPPDRRGLGPRVRDIGPRQDAGGRKTE